MDGWPDLTTEDPADPQYQRSLLTSPMTQAALAGFSQMDPEQLAQLMQVMGGPQALMPTLDTTPDAAGYGIAGADLPESAKAALGPTYVPPSRQAASADTYYGQGPGIALPHPTTHAPKTKGEWLQALMPAILGIAGGAFGGKAGVAGALQGYAKGQQEDIVNAQRQQQIDQQRAVLEANERRYAEMERQRQENNDRLKSVAGSNLLEKALKGASQLNDPKAQAAYLAAHAPELQAYGFDLNRFAPEVSERAKTRYRDWARKALDDAVSRLQKIHGQDVDLGPYFSDTPPAKVKTDAGSLSLKELAVQAGIDPNEYIVSPDELKKHRSTLTPDVQLQVDAAVDQYRHTHDGKDPDIQTLAKMALDAKQSVGEASRAETTLELAQELSEASTLPVPQAITFLSSKSGMTEQQLRTAAEQYARTGEITNLGFGGLIPRQAVMAAQSILYPQENIAANKGQMHAHRALLDQQVKSVANLDQFEAGALKNMAFAEQLRKDAPDVGGSFWNQPIQALAGKGFGDASVKAAQAALENASREVRRIVTDPLLRGHLTVYGQKTADEILPASATLKEVQTVMAVMRQDMANVGDSVKLQAQKNRNWMSRPLLGPDGAMVDRQGNPVEVNSEGLMVNEKGEEVALDDYGRVIGATPKKGPAPPPPGAEQMMRSGPSRTAPARTPTATPPQAAKPGMAPPGQRVFDQLSQQATFTAKDPGTGQVYSFPTQAAADKAQQILNSKRGF